MHWNPKAQAVNKAQRQLDPSRIFPIFFKIAGSGIVELPSFAFVLFNKIDAKLYALIN